MIRTISSGWEVEHLLKNNPNGRTPIIVKTYINGELHTFHGESFDSPSDHAAMNEMNKRMKAATHDFHIKNARSEQLSKTVPIF